MELDVYKHSVTAGDLPDDLNAPVGVFNYFGPFRNMAPFKTLPELPPYWSRQRDFILEKTVLYESNWSTAVAIAVSKMASMAWDIKSAVDLRRRRYQELFLQANGGRGWNNFISQHAQDYLLTDNGAFVEIVRASSGAGSKIIGIMHLDSRRCTRTGDPDVPVIYRDLNNEDHELKWYQVFAISDMPNPSASFHGVGLSAASRSYDVIRRLSSMEKFVLEKVTGARPLSLHFITGITDRQLSTAIESQKEERQARGGVAYGGAILIPFLQKEGVGHVEVPIASLPDNFDRDGELKNALLNYANSIGLDPQDLQPLGGQALGVGAQSVVLHEKAAGKGLAAWRQEWTHLCNEYVLDDATVFAFSERDLRDELNKSQVALADAQFADVLVQNGSINAQQSTQLMVDKGHLPDAFLPQDTTPTAVLTDTDKPNPITPDDQTVAASAPAPAKTVPASTGVPAAPAKPAPAMS